MQFDLRWKGDFERPVHSPKSNGIYTYTEIIDKFPLWHFASVSWLSTGHSLMIRFAYSLLCMPRAPFVCLFVCVSVRETSRRYIYSLGTELIPGQWRGESESKRSLVDHPRKWKETGRHNKNNSWLKILYGLFAYICRRVYLLVNKSFDCQVCGPRGYAPYCICIKKHNK